MDLMDAAATMLAMDRDARPSSEKYLYEHFRPNNRGSKRCERMRSLIQAPMQIYGHSPVVKTRAARNYDSIQCLPKSGLDAGLFQQRWQIDQALGNNPGHVVSLFESLENLLNSGSGIL